MGRALADRLHAETQRGIRVRRHACFALRAVRLLNLVHGIYSTHPSMPCWQTYSKTALAIRVANLHTLPALCGFRGAHPSRAARDSRCLLTWPPRGREEESPRGRTTRGGVAGTRH